MQYRFLVTCATGDIGRELCFHLVEKGHNLMITSRNKERLEYLSQEIKRKHPNSDICYCSADLSDPNKIDDLIQLAQKTSIDGIVFMPPRPPVLPSNNPATQTDILLMQAKKDCCYNPSILLEALLPSMKNSTLKSVVLMSGISSVKPSSNPQYYIFNVVRSDWNKIMTILLKNHRSILFTMVSPDQVNTPKYQQKISPKLPDINLTKTSDVIESIYSDLQSEIRLNGTNTILEKGISTIIPNQQRTWCNFFSDVVCLNLSTFRGRVHPGHL